MALTVGELVAYLDINSARFDTKLAAAQGRFQAAGAAMGAVGARMAGIGKGFSKYLTLPIMGVAIASGIMAAKFQSSMEMIQTQAGGTAEEVEYLSNAILNMKNVQHSPQELANAMYHLRSVGIQGAEAMDALRQAEHLASVGNSDLEATTNALAGAYKSGIKGSETFGGTVATLNAIIGAGNLRMEDLVAAMGSGFLVTAKQFGVSLVDVGAALATMTSRGIPATKGATALKMAFSGMAAPTSGAAKEMERIGMSTTELAAEMRTGGLPAAIAELAKHLKGMGEIQQTASLTKMFGAKSSQAVLTLIGNLKDFQGVQKQVEANAKTSKFAEAIKVQAESAEAKWKKFLSTMKRVSVQMGNQFLPALTKIATFLGDLAEKFGALSPATKKWISTFALVLAAVGPVVMIIGKLIALIGGLVTGIGTVVSMISGLAFAFTAAGAGAATLGEGLALMLATNPVGWAIAAVAAVGALVYGLYRLNQSMRDTIATAEDYDAVTKRLEGPEAEEFVKRMDKKLGGHYEIEAGELVWKPKKVEAESGLDVPAIIKSIHADAAKIRAARIEEAQADLLSAAKIRRDEAAAVVRELAPQAGGKGIRPTISEEDQARLSAARQTLAGANADVTKLEASLNRVEDRDYVLKVEADLKDMNDGLKKTQAELTRMEKIPHPTSIQLTKMDKLRTDIATVKGTIKSVTGKNWKVLIQAKIEREQAKLKGMQTALGKLDKTSTNPKVQANIATLEAGIKKSRAKLKELEGQKTNPPVGIQDNATGAARNIRTNLVNIFGQPIFQDVYVRKHGGDKPEARGGVDYLTRPQSYLAGEAGREIAAFFPLNDPGRSRAVLDQTLSMLGSGIARKAGKPNAASLQRMRSSVTPTAQTAQNASRRIIQVNVMMPGGTTIVGTARQVAGILAPHIGRELDRHEDLMGRGR